MRIKYTRYKTVESSSLFLFTCTFILFIQHKFNIRSQFASSNTHHVLKHVNVINCWKDTTVFPLSMQKMEESNKYQYQHLISES